jgi:hypothetical protein
MKLLFHWLMQRVSRREHGLESHWHDTIVLLYGISRSSSPCVFMSFYIITSSIYFHLYTTILGDMVKLNSPMRFEVLAAVTLKSTFFWDVMPCSLIEILWHLGGTYSVSLDCHSKSSNQISKHQPECLLLGLPLRPWGWRQYLLPKHQ